MSLWIEPEPLKIEVARYVYKIVVYKRIMMTFISYESWGKSQCNVI